MKVMHIRKLLQGDGDITLPTILPPATTANYPPDPLFVHPKNTSSPYIKTPYKSTAHFDTAMALTILVVITALFLMFFISLYIRSFSTANSRGATYSRRRRHPFPPPSSSSSRSRNQKGLDPSTVRSLPLVPYNSGDAFHQIIEECRICLSEFEEKEIVKIIPYCGHLFHPECIDTWLASHVSCPLCRSFVKGGGGGGEEKCLGVMQVRVDHGGNDLDERSTVEEVDTWREVGTNGLRRTCSFSCLVDRAVLRRSSSF